TEPVSAAGHDRSRARGGEGRQERSLVFRFPSELCTDGGRALNNNESTWPDTLVGQPREFHDFWREHLRPQGYRLRAEILDYPGGVPGDVGFTLAWDGPGPRPGRS